jgi:dolichol-phosphate mannosyltransferase
MQQSARLAVIVPVLNERDNIAPMVQALDAALAGIAWEVVFVDDDSRDGTAETVRALAACDTRVRCLHRLGRRGLASAVVEGVLATAAPYVAVLDGDLQHDERKLPEMLQLIEGEALDLVVGSRYVADGSVGDWQADRRRLSAAATWLSQRVLRQSLSDPLSGFFMLRRSAFEGAMRQLSAQGFKILLDLLASAPQPLKLREIPFTFRPRRHGASKLDSLVAIEFLTLLLDKLVGRTVPVRFILFAAIGGFGFVIHMAVLALAHRGFGVDFDWAQGAATLIAMANNFWFNNRLTYRDRRLHGAALIRGFLSFAAVCSLGAIANVGVATAVFGRGGAWWLAGMAGVLVGAVSNFALSAVFTWRQRPS